MNACAPLPTIGVVADGSAVSVTSCVRMANASRTFLPVASELLAAEIARRLWRRALGHGRRDGERLWLDVRHTVAVGATACHLLHRRRLCGLGDRHTLRRLCMRRPSSGAGAGADGSRRSELASGWLRRPAYAVGGLRRPGRLRRRFRDFGRRGAGACRQCLLLRHDGRRRHAAHRSVGAFLVEAAHCEQGAKTENEQDAGNARDRDQSGMRQVADRRVRRAWRAPPVRGRGTLCMPPWHDRWRRRSKRGRGNFVIAALARSTSAPGRGRGRFRARF